MNGSYLALELRSFTPRCFLFLSRIIFLFLKDNIFIKNYFYHVLIFHQELENFMLLWN